MTSDPAPDEKWRGNAGEDPLYGFLPLFVGQICCFLPKPFSFSACAVYINVSQKTKCPVRRGTCAVNTNPEKKQKKRKSALAVNAEYALFVFVTTLVRVLPLHAAYAVLDFIAWCVRHFSSRHGTRTPERILHSGFVKTKAEANRLVDLVVDSFADNWSAFKVLMKGVGIDCGYCRAPYAPLTKTQERRMLGRFMSLVRTWSKTHAPTLTDPIRPYPSRR